MKLMTFNVRLWTRDTDKNGKDYWKTRMSAMKKMIEDKNPDVICFQEMIYPATRYIPKCYRKAGFSFHHHIYVKKGIKTKHSFYSVFYQFTDIISEERSFRMFCVHGRWEEKYERFLISGLINHHSDPSILCGDFNMDYEDLQMYYGWIGTRNSARMILDKEVVPTCYEREIDLFFLNGIEPKDYEVVLDNYGVDRISDHRPVIIEI